MADFLEAYAAPVRPAGPHRRHGRRGSPRGRGASWCCAGDRGSRPTTSSWRPVRSRAPDPRVRRRSSTRPSVQTALQRLPQPGTVARRRRARRRRRQLGRRDRARGLPRRDRTLAGRPGHRRGDAVPHRAACRRPADALPWRWSVFSRVLTVRTRAGRKFRDRRLTTRPPARPGQAARPRRGRRRAGAADRGRPRRPPGARGRAGPGSVNCGLVHRLPAGLRMDPPAGIRRRRRTRAGTRRGAGVPGLYFVGSVLPLHADLVAYRRGGSGRRVRGRAPCRTPAGRSAQPISRRLSSFAAYIASSARRISSSASVAPSESTAPDAGRRS